MLLTVETFRPTADYAEWVAGVVELPACYGHGDCEAEAVRRCQAAALERLGAEIKNGERAPLGYYESVAFVLPWGSGLKEGV